ncbi:MAG: sigma-70 family RNA polymerase sigma factor [Candidatus Acidiferrales bacterium]
MPANEVDDREDTAKVSRTPLEEAALIARIQAGDKELFLDLIRPYQRRVYAAALAILRNEADAEEVTQEAILKALAHLGTFRRESRFSTWLIQIVINEARMRLRKNHPERITSLEEQVTREGDEGAYKPKDFADWREIPSEALSRKEIRAALLHALASLAQKYREVFVLRDVESLSIEETARILGITAGSVKTRLLRARLMLRDFLTPGIGGAWTGSLPFKKGNNPWE